MTMFRTAPALGLALAACGALFTSMPGHAASAPAAASFYRFVGHWHGQGALTVPGQAPVKLALSLACSKEASGWAVACHMSAKSKSMTMSESDLMGVDPVTGQAHWYAVTNQGETHDHLAEWAGARTMKAHYDWKQDGRRMREDIVFEFKPDRTVAFSSVTSADGKPAGEFAGTLRR